MTTLQKYLEQEYPIGNKRELITEIKLEEINKERESRGETDLLEGGELDLDGFKELERIEIDSQFLKTPLTKLNIGNIDKIKQIIWLEAEKDTEEERKIWEELGIENNFSKKKLVKEIHKILKIFNQNSEKKASVKFSTENAPLEILGEKKSLTEINEEGFQIYLFLERKDKIDAFNSSLIFWNLAWELSSFKFPKYAEEPSFWSCFYEELKWMENNLSKFYQASMITLEPSAFTFEELNMKDFFAIYYPNNEVIAENEVIRNTINAEIIDKVWQGIKKEMPEAINRELSNNSDEEKKKQLAFNITVEKNADKHYTIKIQHHPENPLKEKFKELTNDVPLKLELEKVKEEKKQLPTSEAFEKLNKKIQFLHNVLQDYLDKDSYLKLEKEINNI